MNALVITIDWPYFLGLLGGLIAVAWYSSGRFTKVETLLDTIDRRLTNVEGRFSGAFKSQSPISLTEKGKYLLEESGLKKYIDENKVAFISKCKAKKDLTNAYDVQEAVFEYFDNLEFEQALEERLKEFSFQQGVDMSVTRRVGGIYLRNILLEELNMKEKDLDGPTV